MEPSIWDLRELWLYSRFCVKHILSANFGFAMSALSVLNYVYMRPPNLLMHLAWKYVKPALAVRISECIAKNDWVIVNRRGCHRKEVWSNWRYHIGNFRHLGQDCLCSAQDLNGRYNSEWKHCHRTKPFQSVKWL